MDRKYFISFRCFTCLLALSIFAIQLFRVFNSPVWRDDAFLSSVSKNLASGNGYTAIFFEQSFPFDYGITSGPTVILPAALLMSIFGNHYWVPGLTIMLLIWVCLMSLFIVIRRFFGSELSWPLCFSSLFFSILVSTQFDSYNYAFEIGEPFAIWHLFMGELPASFLIILALLVLCSSVELYRRISIGGFILGLAIITKAIVVIAATIVLLGKSYLLVRNKDLKNSKKILFIAILAVMAASPFVLFELYKIWFLGFDYYQGQLSKSSNFTRSLSCTEGGLDRIISRINYLTEVYLLPFWLVISLCLLAPKPVNLESGVEKHLYAAGSILMTSFLFHLLWWIGFSNGYPRYLIVGFIYLSFAISFLLARAIKKSVRNHLIPYTLLVSICCIRIFILSQYSIPNLFIRNPRLTEQLIVKDLLVDFQNTGSTLVGCGNNFELEYLLPKAYNFKNCHQTDLNTIPFVLTSYFVYDKRMSYVPDPENIIGADLPESIVSKCQTTIFKTEKFFVAKCNEF